MNEEESFELDFLKTEKQLEHLLRLFPPTKKHKRHKQIMISEAEKEVIACLRKNFSQASNVLIHNNTTFFTIIINQQTVTISIKHAIPFTIIIQVGGRSVVFKHYVLEHFTLDFVRDVINRG